MKKVRQASIANEILMYLRSIRNQKKEVSLYDPIGVDKEGNEVTLLDLLGSSGEEITEEIELEEERNELYKRLDVLDEKERYVVELRYGLNDRERKTQREIAKEMKISRSYVSRIEKKAVNKISKALEKGKP